MVCYFARNRTVILLENAISLRKDKRPDIIINSYVI